MRWGMEPIEVVEALWERIEARDWAGAGALVAEDAVVEWPVSRERIVGRTNFVAVNSDIQRAGPYMCCESSPAAMRWCPKSRCHM